LGRNACGSCGAHHAVIEEFTNFEHIASQPMKYLLLIPTLFFIIFPAASQKKITIGKPYPVTGAETRFYFVDGGEILVVKELSESIVLQKLDAASLTLQKTKICRDFPKDFHINEIQKIKGRYFTFYTIWVKGNQQLFYYEIDFAGGTFKGEAKKLLEIPKYAESLKYNFSKDSSKIVIQYRLAPKNSKPRIYDEIVVHVFDQNLHEQWNRTVIKSHVENEREDNVDLVDSKGNFYIATKVFKDNTTDIRKSGKEEPNYSIEILKLAQANGEVTHVNIDLEKKFIQKIWISESTNGSIVAGGFYHIIGNENDVLGLLFFNVNENNNVSHITSQEIPVEILNQYVSERVRNVNEERKKNNRAVFVNLHMRSMEVQDDDSIILVGEQLYTESGNKFETFHNDDLLVTKFSDSGQVIWMRRIPKRLHSGGGFNGRSYFYLNGSGEHYFIFTDNEKNLNLAPTDVPADHANGTTFGQLVAYKIKDDTGLVTKIFLFDSRDVSGMKLYYQPYQMIATGPSSFVLEAYKKNNEDILIDIELE
jgi:hypothetical protein